MSYKKEHQEISKIILGYMFSSKEFLSKSANFLDETFFPEEYKKLFKAIIQYYQRYKEIISLDIIIDQLQKKNATKEDIAFYTYLINDLKSLKCTSKEFQYNLDQFKKSYINVEIRRSLGASDIVEKDNIIELLQDKRYEAALEKMKKTVVGLETKIKINREREGTLKESVDLRKEKYLEAKINPDITQGILLGYRYLDENMNGLKPGELLVVVGNTGDGKSITLLNMGHNAWANGKNIVYISLEMDREKTERRFTSRMTLLDSRKIRDAKLSESEEVLYFEALEKQKNAQNHWYTDDVPRNCTPLFVESKIQQITSLFPIDLLIIDYLGIMSPTISQSSDSENLGKIAEELHELAREYKIPIVTAQQATSKRHVATRNTFGTHRVGRAERIADNCDVMLQIETPEDDIDLSDVIIYHAVKMRDAPTGKFRMCKDFSRTKIVDFPKSEIKTESLIDV